MKKKILLFQSYANRKGERWNLGNKKRKNNLHLGTGFASQIKNSERDFARQTNPFQKQIFHRSPVQSSRSIQSRQTFYVPKQILHVLRFTVENWMEKNSTISKLSQSQVNDEIWVIKKKKIHI